MRWRSGRGRSRAEENPRLSVAFIARGDERGFLAARRSCDCGRPACGRAGRSPSHDRRAGRQQGPVPRRRVLRASPGAGTARLAVQVSAVKAVPGRLRRATRNPKREHPELTAAWQAMAPALEVELRHDVVEPQPGDQVASLVARLQPVLERIVRSTTPGSPLRRIEALGRASALVRSAVAAAVRPVGVGSSSDEPAHPPQPAVARKPGRARRRKGAVT